MLQFITHRRNGLDEIDGAKAVLDGGCRWIQLRMKDATPSEITDTGLRLRSLCDQYGATFILDDHVELVDAIGADGVGARSMHCPRKCGNHPLPFSCPQSAAQPHPNRRSP